MKKYNKAEIMKKALSLKEEYAMPKGEVKFNIWSNYGKVRAYYTCSWKSDYQNNKGYYVAL